MCVWFFSGVYRLMVSGFEGARGQPLELCPLLHTSYPDLPTLRRGQILWVSIRVAS